MSDSLLSIGSNVATGGGQQMTLVGREDQLAGLQASAVASCVGESLNDRIVIKQSVVGLASTGSNQSSLCENPLAPRLMAA